MQWVSGKHGGPKAGWVQVPNRMGDPDEGAEGKCFGGRLQAELKGCLFGPVWGLPMLGGGLLGVWALTIDWAGW
jgi:hypothetical protein